MAVDWLVRGPVDWIVTEKHIRSDSGKRYNSIDTYTHTHTHTHLQKLTQTQMRFETYDLQSSGWWAWSHAAEKATIEYRSIGFANWQGDKRYGYSLGRVQAHRIAIATNARGKSKRANGIAAKMTCWLAWPIGIRGTPISHESQCERRPLHWNIIWKVLESNLGHETAIPKLNSSNKTNNHYDRRVISAMYLSIIFGCNNMHRNRYGRAHAFFKH